MWAAKFGGSSLANAQGFKRCANLTIAEPETRLIILSATWNTTNLLEKAAFEQVRRNHDIILKELNLDSSLLDPLYNEMDTILPNHWAERCALGERLSSRIFASHLQTITERPVSLLDARNLMITDKNHLQATPLMEDIAIRCRQELHPLLNCGHIVVTQGFIGADINGKTTLLEKRGIRLQCHSIGRSCKGKTSDHLERCSRHIHRRSTHR